MKILKFALVCLLVLMTASAADVAGRYAGEWKSNGGGGAGAFRMSLESGSGGACKLEVTFAFAGSDVKTSMHECKVDGSKVDASYDFELMGNQLRSHIVGELKGDAIKGTYQTTTTDGGPVDEGVWNASRQ
jgi:hypothetical protein